MIGLRAAGAAILLILLLFPELSLSQSSQGSPEVSPSLSGHNMALDSRGGAQTIKLGNGRGRLRIPLEGLRPAALDEQGRVAVERRSFVADWLRLELPRRFPGIDRVELVETITSRANGREFIVSTRGDLEVHGELKPLESAQRWVNELLNLSKVRIRLDCRMIQREKKSSASIDPQVEILDQKALDLLLPLFSAPERRVMFALSHGRPEQQRDLVARRFLRQVRVEKLTSGDVVVPEIKTAYEGFQGTAAALLLPGARELVVDCDFGLGVIVRPVPSRSFLLLDRAYTIESPEVVSLRWASDRILLGPEEVGFLVTGIRLPVSRDSESAPTTTLDILVQVQVEALPRRFELGHMMGFDDLQGLGFARVEPTVNLQPGRRLSATRKGRVVGRVEVVEIVGRIATVRLVRGKLARGDTLR